MKSALLALLLVGCNFGVKDIAVVPEQPTYNRDVKPVLLDHCVLCHGAPPKRGAPAWFRLDQYDSSDGVMGVNAMAESVVHQTTADKMPPAAAWGDGVGPNAKQMLERWLANGAPR
jgi:uncharacterized membrane protein